MTEELIVIGDNYDVKELVNLSDKCDFAVDLIFGNVDVSAKSLLRVLGIDRSHPWLISYEGYNDPLKKFVNEHAFVNYMN